MGTQGNPLNYIKQVLTQAPETFDDEKLEEIFNELILFEPATKFDTKQYKKLYRLSLKLLKYKGGQINGLHEQIKGLAEKQIQLQSTGECLEILLRYHTSIYLFVLLHYT